MMREAVPLYLSIAARILDEHAADPASGRQQLPSEADLAAQFGVSRSTIREALGHLSSRNRVRKLHGIGTFLLPAPQRILDGIETLGSYVDTIARSGREPGDLILKVEEVPVPQAFSRGSFLGTPGHEQAPYDRPALLVESLRTADGSPIIYCHDYVLPPFASRITPAEVVGHRRAGVGLLDMLEQHLGLDLQFSQLHARAVTAREQLASALDVPAGSPILELRGVTYADGAAPAYFSQNWFLTDEYEFQIVRRKAPAEPDPAGADPLGAKA